MRSKLWFVVAGAIALAGFAAAGFYLMPRLGGLDSAMKRAVVPGSVVLELDQPGDYTIYHEQNSVVDGQYYASPAIGGLRVNVVAEATGAALALRSSTNTSYAMGNRKGVSMFAFSVEQAGRYRLTAGFADGRGEPKVVLAVEHGMFARIFSLIGGTLAFVFGGLGIAGAIVAVTIWQREKAKKA